MTLLDPADSRPIHFVGIAGAGMCALAELFARRGIPISGCDGVIEGAAGLARYGVSLQVGHDPAHVRGARGVVYTAAMREDHPELAAARAAGLPVMKRAAALGEVTAGRELVGIAGTHGKTTTTVLTAEALAAAGRDPTALVGGRVAAWQGNLRAGSDALYVVEADEYDRSFLTLQPTVAVVTNIEADHLDIYHDLADIEATFADYAGRARWIVLCADDAGANALRTPASAEVIRYGVTSPDARLRAESLGHADGRQRLALRYDGDAIGELSLRVPGRHNALNALAAVGTGLAMGLTLDAMRPGLEAFTGVARRFERVGEARGILVIDDYAHHPTEIAATLAAARGAFPGRRIVAAFQPHLFSRTRDFAREFGEALAGADTVFLTEIYAAREAPIPGVSSALVADAVGRAGGALAWRGERPALAPALAGAAREGDVVLLMGAGDITHTGPELLARIQGG
ncbi:MAG TPA: UDP-N-acetylmuramate--L-alanine ligase [Gemmatimonadaceae bacterium]